MLKYKREKGGLKIQRETLVQCVFIVHKVTTPNNETGLADKKKKSPSQKKKGPVKKKVYCVLLLGFLLFDRLFYSTLVFENNIGVTNRCRWVFFFAVV